MNHESPNNNFTKLLFGLQSTQATTTPVTDCLCAFGMFDGCLSDTLGYYVMNDVSTKMNCLDKGKSIYDENKIYMLCLWHIETVYVAGNLHKYWHG